MKKLAVNIILVIIIGLITCVIPATAQKRRPKPAPKPLPAIFAVLNDGGRLEPIAYVSKSKLSATISGGDDPKALASFNRNFYKVGQSYRLIFGAADSGSVVVKSADPKAECSTNMAQVMTTAVKTPLKGLVMGLATNAPGKISRNSYRRLPTPVERAAIETLVRAEYAKQKLTPNTLRYHNLTALDLDNDLKPEFVGSYWIEIDRLTRGLLFFIANSGADDKLSIGYSDYRLIDQAKVMSGEIKTVDEGVYHELLLDAYDYDGDGVSNVFTYRQSFEGAGFTVYRKAGKKWAKVFEGSNYHCAY